MDINIRPYTVLWGALSIAVGCLIFTGGRCEP